MKKHRDIVSARVFLLFCVFPVLLYGSDSWADPADQLGRDMANVKDKAPNCIVIADHGFNISSNYVIVTTSASIIDIDGKRISLKQLKVPCDAKISLYKRKRQIDPELIRLEVKKYAHNASSSFTIKKPFVRLPE